MELDKKNALPDVQSLHDGRNIAITRVGIRGVTLPITVESKNGPQHSVASLETTVSLPADQKGTHMSRFIALVEENDEPLNADVVRKTAPVSRLDSLMNYQAAWIADAQDGEIRVRQEVTAPVTSLCPCSKEISRYGAHNQRSHLRSSLVLSVSMSLEEQISIAEDAASCQLWARLKRSDEKYVTEYAYDHPKFVEDLVRDMAKTLNADDRVDYYLVEAENFESIHNHSAYAYIERNKKA